MVAWWSQEGEKLPLNEPQTYFARARLYLPAVMALQDMTTVQALLCLVQYYFRAPTETPIWFVLMS